ncbi:hypothetical protein EON65_31280 [archaeon]|nr:MAG: hypothetical protein EON65_31280 [archaeon]
MLTAGCVFLLVREGLSDSQDVYEMSYGLAQDYKEIAVSATMITEHLPNSYFTEINRVAKREIDYNPFNVE